jgi:transcriptional regulator with XRE-family HTH domain
MSKKIITAAQVRAARSLLGWSQAELAEKTMLSRATIADLELERREPSQRSLRDLVYAFLQHGVRFVDPEENGGRGVRFITPYWPVEDWPMDHDELQRILAMVETARKNNDPG